MTGGLLALTLWTAGPDLPSPPALGAAPRALGSDWQTLSPLLRVRPFLPAALQGDEARQVLAGLGRTPTEGLRFAVVVDTPDTLGVVGAATAESWDKSAAEVYAVARAHTRKALQADLKRYTENLPGLSGATVEGELWTGGDTVAALADLDTFLGPAPHGALIAAPSREMVLVHRFTPTDSPQVVLATFAALAVIGAPEGHEPFSPDLYWWHDGQLRVLTVEDPDPGRPRVVPGPAVDALTRSLTPPRKP